MRQSIIRSASIAFLSSLLPITLAACVPVPATRGQILSPEQLALLKPGISKEEVASTVGTPSMQSTFDEHEWYYVGEFTEQRAFFRPETKTRSVVALTFDDSENLKDVKTLTAKDGQNIVMNEQVTEAPGQDLTIMQQLLGNIGKFSDKK